MDVYNQRLEDVMSQNKKWTTVLVLSIVLVINVGMYLWPVPRVPFDELYAKVDADQVASLQAFRVAHPPQRVEVNGVAWEYVSFGQGEETILFLHGMTGAYDIWWQQMEALQADYRVISVTYPALDTLEELSAGVLGILDAEGVDAANVVGTSLGGYLTQYMVANHPDRVLRAVFSNTFPPNELIAEKNKTIGTALPYLPEWLVIDVLRGSFAESVYPASGNDELTLAFLMEIGHGRMTKGQVLGRYRCVVDPFTAPDPAVLGIPVLIIEADNDPLVELALREQLKQTYPTAVVQTLSGVGHFPYLKLADEYTGFLREFFATPIQ
jgi:pimeloyl-ACP methyl ester carboxylesterase